MHKLTKLICLLSLLGTVLTFTPTHAQDDVLPEHIYYTANGYLYEWNLETDEVTQLTDTGYVNILHHAPLGRQIAFNWHTTRDPIIGGYEAGMDFEGADVFMLADGQLRNVTNQSQHVRSELSWSSNGENLMWWQAEITQAADSTGEQLDNLKIYFYQIKNPNSDGIPSFEGGVDAGLYYVPQPFYFGQSYAFLMYGAGPEIRLAVTNTYTGSRNSMVVSSWDMGGRVHLFDVQSPAGPYLGLYYEDYGQWDLMNPITYTTESLQNDTVELRADTPDSWRWRYDPAQSHWQLYDASQNLMVEFEGHIGSRTIAVNSNGTGTVYAQDGALNVRWADGTTRTLPVESVNSVVWGAQSWHVAAEITMPTTIPENARTMSAENCGGTRLAVGMTGTFTTTYGEFIYKHMHPQRFVVGLLPDGAHLTILNGPLCLADLPDRHYWQVEAYGLTGWILLSDFALEVE